jgi:hypothetical protein
MLIPTHYYEGRCCSFLPYIAISAISAKVKWLVMMHDSIQFHSCYTQTQMSSHTLFGHKERCFKLVGKYISTDIMKIGIKREDSCY